MKAAKYWADYLRRRGIRYAFGQGGLEAVEIVEALRQAEIEFVWVHHESSAAFAGAAMGELTGVPGLCVATRGPGASNMLTGVAHAWLDRSPLIAVSGDTDPGLKDRLSHQGLPLVRIFEPVVKCSTTLTAANVATVLPRAFDLAVDDPQGPVYLAFSQAEAGRDMPLQQIEPIAEGWLDAQADCSALEEAVGMLTQSVRPLIYVGLGVHQWGAERELMRMAETLGAPVIVTPKAKGHFPEDHALFAGVYQAYQDGPVKCLLRETDLVLGIGLDGVELLHPWNYDAPVINLGFEGFVDPCFPRLKLIAGDLRSSLVRLAELAGKDLLSTRWEWLPEVSALTRQAISELLAPDSAESQVTPQSVLTELRRQVRPEGIVTCDVGSHRLLTAQFWPTFWPGTFLTSNGLSSVGYALPAALAAKLAFPDRQVVCLTGDGGLLALPGELQTIARLRLGVIVIVWADFGSSSTRLEHEKMGYPPAGGTYGGQTDFELLARSFGIWSRTIEQSASIRSTLVSALGQRGPALVQVPISYDVYRGMEI